MGDVSARKITKPLLNNVLFRERISNLLNDGLRRKALWISAPAGSGKTTLVSSYIERMNIPCIWYRVDSYDDDIATFFYTMGIAAKKAAQGKTIHLPLLTPEYLGGISRFTENYFEALYKKLTTASVIVLDDYQAVPHSSKLHSVVYAALSVLPENINVIIISRESPLPVFSPMMIRNDLDVIGWEDVRFTFNEAADLLTSIHGTISQDDINNLYDLSDGWVSALIVRHKKHNKGDYKSWLSYSRETLFSYFTSEVFDNLEKDMQDFLIKTAFFKQMTVNMAQTLTGCKDAGKMLEFILSKNYFIEKYDLKETAYSYHPLFRLFLLEKANLYGDEIVVIRNKATECLMKQHLMEDAAELSIENYDWKTLSEIILSNAEQFLKQGRTNTLLMWLNALPDDLIENQPWFLYFKGWCTAFSNPSEGFVLLEKAFNGFTAVGDMVGSLLSWSGCVDVIAMIRGPFSRLDRFIDWSNTAIGKDFKFPSLAIETSVVTSMTGVLTFRGPEVESAEDWLNRALELIDSDIEINSRLGLASVLHIFFMYRGNFLTCAGIVRKMTQISQHHSATPFALIMWSLQEAIYYHIIDTNLEKCAAVAKKGLSLSAESGIIVYEPVIAMMGTYGLLSDGKIDEAEELINFASERIPPNAYFDHANLQYTILYRDLLIENYTSAVINGELVLQFSQQTEALFLIMFAHLGLSQAYFEVKRYDDAFKQMELSRRCVRNIKLFEKEYIFLYIEAYYYLTLGERDRGLALLDEALKQSAEFNITNLVLWRPKVMRRLFAEALKEDIETDYVKMVISARAILPEGLTYELIDWPYHFKFLTLGRFQIVKGGKAFVFKGKVQKNVLAMLKAIIAFGTSGAAESYIADMLWPDSDGDEAYQSLKTTLYRLRQFLGSNDAIIFSDRKITLDFRYCQTDVLLIEEIHNKINSLRDCLSDKSSDNSDLIRQLTNTAVSLYNGEFMPGEEGYPWLEPARMAVKNRFIDILSAAVTCTIKKEQWYEAKRYCQRGIEVDEFAENFYKSLIVCYGKMELPLEAQRTYNRLRSLFHSKSGIKSD
ncbi:MAG: hypothetical protein HQL00_16645 [Nitrospirae bacterium]|nr:hypothetical protein [Nitrospirota bacterium]